MVEIIDEGTAVRYIKVNPAFAALMNKSPEYFNGKTSGKKFSVSFSLSTVDVGVPTETVTKWTSQIMKAEKTYFEISSEYGGLLISNFHLICSSQKPWTPYPRQSILFPCY